MSALEITKDERGHPGTPTEDPDAALLAPGDVVQLPLPPLLLACMGAGGAGACSPLTAKPYPDMLLLLLRPADPCDHT